MRVFSALLWLGLASAVLAIDARKAAADYPVQAELPDFQVGAEYLVQSFLADGLSFTVDDYLIVETAIFPKGEAKVDVRRFNLRITGKNMGKNMLAAQTPGMVSASIRYPDWRRRPALEASAGPVILGRPPATPRFPGDNRRRVSGVREDGPPEIDYDDAVKRAALSEGKFNRPIAGFLYFPYDGKLKAIRTVEMVVDDKVLKLR